MTTNKYTIDEPWPTIQQVADWAQCSTKTVRRNITNGTLDARRFGAQLIRINPESLAAWGTPLQYMGDDQ